LAVGRSRPRDLPTIPAVRSGFVLRWKWRIFAVSFNLLARWNPGESLGS
jgi:hypothetical protein